MSPAPARLAYLALVPAALLAALLALQGAGKPFGVEVPVLVPLALALAGLVLGAVAAHRRSGGLALCACALLALALVPAGSAEPGPVSYALGILLGGLLLAYGELVHMGARHGRTHAAVEGVDLARVQAEALKTLARRGLLALGLAGLGAGLAFLLAAFGPLRLREAVETRAHLGVAVASLALMGALGLLVLVRSDTQESAPDADD